MSLLVAGTINGAPAIGVRGMAWTIKSIPSIRLAGDLGIADGTINLVRHNKGVPVCGVAPPNSRPKLLGGQATHMVRKAHVRGVLDPSVWYAIRLGARPWGPPIKPRIVGEQASPVETIIKDGSEGARHLAELDAASSTIRGGPPVEGNQPAVVLVSRCIELPPGRSIWNSPHTKLCGSCCYCWPTKLVVVRPSRVLLWCAVKLPPTGSLGNTRVALYLQRCLGPA